MSVVEITDAKTGSRARIAVASGFNCFDFVSRAENEDVSVISAEEGFEAGRGKASHNGIPILFPFPNRIRSGKYTWDGQHYEMPLAEVANDGSGHAIHGFCLDRPWRTPERTESSVTGVFRISEDAPERRAFWPADAELTVRYSLQGNTLRTDFTVHNPDKVPLPWGLGTHAYFRLPLSDQSSAANCTVFAPTHRRWELESCLPTGRKIDAAQGAALDSSPPFGQLKLDDAYTDLKADNGVITYRLADPDSGWSMVQKTSSAFRELVAFTPPWATAVCLEPYTCMTDAINLHAQGLDTGLQVLAPGATWTGWIEMIAERSVA